MRDLLCFYRFYARVTYKLHCLSSLCTYNENKLRSMYVRLIKMECFVEIRINYVIYGFCSDGLWFENVRSGDRVAKCNMDLYCVKFSCAL